MANMKCGIKVSYGGKAVSLLSYTSDMAAWSFSLPAGQPGACPGMVARDDKDICHGCYAQINRYNMPNVLNAQWVRFNWLRVNLRTDEGKRLIEDTFVDAINKYSTNGFFRGHDSGDFFNPDYAHVWYRVASRLPNINFWFPTRSHHVPSILPALRRLASLPNITIRPSAISLNDYPPFESGLSKGTTVVTESWAKSIKVCPKTINGGTCVENTCRSCWDNNDLIGYLSHGYLGRSVMANAMSDAIKSCRAKIAAPYIKLTVERK